LLQYKLILISYITIIFITAVVSITIPYIIGDFLDALVYDGDVSAIIRFSLIFAGLNIIRIIKGFISSRMYVYMQAHMSYSLNMDTLRRVQNFSLTYINKNDSAYLSQRINSDSGEIIIFCITVLQNILSNLTMLILPFIILLFINWPIAILLSIFLGAYILLYFLFRKPLFNVNLSYKESQNKFFASIFEQLKYAKLIKINSVQREINKRASSRFIELKNSAMSRQKISYIHSGMDGIISTVAQIVLFVVGGIQVLNGNFTIGMFTVFSSYFNMMMSSSRYFFNLGAAYQQVSVAYNRLSDIHNYEQESIGSEIINDIKQIELKDVKFSYDGLNYPQCFNAKFDKGKLYAIVGKNGAGKTTLINLIIGMYIDEYIGEVFYDGTNIKNIEMIKARRELIGFAEQEPFLVKDSILYNITFNDAGALESSDKARMNRIVDILNMKEFISKHDAEFTINEKNTNTSGGEKQKISILKVLYRNPSVMIFDEPTSALDIQTATKFISYLNEIKANKIIVIVSHDEFIIKHCDRVFEI